MKWDTPNGTVDVATEGLALFFNNNTILYGMDAYKAGMTKEEWTEALVDRGFEEVLAKAFVIKYWWQRDYE